MKCLIIVGENPLTATIITEMNDKMTIKRIQFKLNERIFAVEIDTKNSILIDEDINNAQNKIAEQINKNNESINNIFFECLEIVCADCGISLNDDEKEIGLCNSCEAIQK